MGRSLRRRLRERLKQFRRIFGITLTIDGSPFSSPEEAWRYVMDNRLLSLLVKKLFNAGYLKSRAYFWVVEWQEETQQAHWHLLVDSEFVPFGKIVEEWSRFRPKWAPALAQRVTAKNYKDLDRPAFGSVRFTLSSKDAWKASGYVTKYLVKVPKYGFPDWVLDYVGRIPRYGHSRGFFPDGTSAGRKSVDSGVSFDPKRLEREPKTLRERIAECKQQTTVLRVAVTRENGERFEDRPQFKGTLKIPFHEACVQLGVAPESCRELQVGFECMLKLWSLEPRNTQVGNRGQEIMEDW